MMTDTLNHAFFFAQLEQLFQVNLDSEKVILKLIKLDLYSNDSNSKEKPGQSRESFSLVFRGPREQQLQQGTFFLNNEALTESIAVFLVPIGPDDHGLCYEAVFN